MDDFNIQIIHGGETVRVKGKYRFSMNRNRATIHEVEIEAVTGWDNLPRPYSVGSIEPTVRTELKTGVETCY